VRLIVREQTSSDEAIRGMPKERFKLIAEVSLFLFREDEVLLLRRVNTGYEDGNYHVIAGHLEGNEEITMAMIREAKEEAGIEISPDDIKVVGVMHRRVEEERICFFCTASKWTGEIVNAEPHKCDDLSWFHLDNLPENIVPFVRRALQNYQSGRFYDKSDWH
jgi:8-oxo-dGTP diphosphatase